MLIMRIIVFASTIGITATWFINACNWIYDCGCRSWWSGAAKWCNIHLSQGPHCPWCLESGFGGYSTFVLILMMQSFLIFHSGAMKLKWRFLWALVSFPAGVVLFGLFFGWLYNYWHRWSSIISNARQENQRNSWIVFLFTFVCNSDHITVKV